MKLKFIIFDCRKISDDPSLVSCGFLDAIASLQSSIGCKSVSV